MNKQKKIAAINDLSGVGRCSLTAALPIISAMGITCSVMPTAILSNHTGYSTYFFEDCTNQMKHFADNWKKLGLSFDCIYSGFLGSEAQIETVRSFISDFKRDGTKVVVDPVMGDNGKIYTTYTPVLCSEMKQLAAMADIVTPNITEACVLSDREYSGESLSVTELCSIAESICKLGSEAVIITGCKADGTVSNFAYCDGCYRTYSSELIPKYYTGTGDTFASVMSGLVTLGYEVFDAVEFATGFVHKVTAYSYANGLDTNGGVCFEKYLGLLTDLQSAD